MTRRADALAETLLQGATALAELAATLADAEWQTRVPRDGRTVGVIVHHVATMYPLAGGAGGGLIARLGVRQASSRDGYRLDLHAHAAGQACHHDGRAGRLVVAKRLSIRLVQPVVVAQIDQEHRGLHHPVEIGARGS
jgi:hypothetical protein